MISLLGRHTVLVIFFLILSIVYELLWFRIFPSFKYACQYWHKDLRVLLYLDWNYFVVFCSSGGLKKASRWFISSGIKLMSADIVCREKTPAPLFLLSDIFDSMFINSLDNVSTITLQFVITTRLNIFSARKVVMLDKDFSTFAAH